MGCLNKIMNKIDDAQFNINSAGRAGFFYEKSPPDNRYLQYISALFGETVESVLSGRDVIIVGAGSFGQDLCRFFRRCEIAVTSFADNCMDLHGQNILNLEVQSIDKITKKYDRAVFVVAIVGFEKEICDQLKKLGIPEEQIRRKVGDIDWQELPMISDEANYLAHQGFYDTKPASYREVIVSNRHKIERVYNLLSDQKSKDLFISKLAVHGSNLDYLLLRDFIVEFSEPYSRFGPQSCCPHLTPEDAFYFDNDIFELRNDEVYVDVGAYDGDTVKTFLQATDRFGVSAKNIYAFEPDPRNFERLHNVFGEHPVVSCHEVGLWRESDRLRFNCSDESHHNDQSGEINSEGSAEINVTSIDEFFRGKNISLVKMDPPGRIIHEIISGGSEVIKKNKPNLILGTYHSLNEFLETPIRLNELSTDYKFYLRHNTYHLCDTALYAIA